MTRDAALKKILTLFLGLAFYLNSFSQKPVFNCFDLDPDLGSSDPALFTHHKGLLFFTAQTTEYGRELWVTDGTRDGTKMVRDINPGSAGSEIGWMIPFRDRLYFGSNDMVKGTVLGFTDGTDTGTHIYANTAPGSRSSFSRTAIVCNGSILFVANNSKYGNELWTTDGTAAGTRLLKDIYPGFNGAFTQPVFTAYRNKVYFSARSKDTDFELWVTDGTDSGTKLVKDIDTGKDGSYVRDMMEYGGKLYFTAIGPRPYVKLWVTDGTDTGTHIAKDLSLTCVTVFQDKLLLMGDDNITGNEMWVCDGPASGIRLLKDMIPGKAGVSPADPVIYKDRLYFGGRNNYQQQLWVTNGTDTGSHLVLTLATLMSTLTPTHLTVRKDRLYFLARTDDDITRLFSSDGTEKGTEVIEPETLNNVKALNGTVIFTTYKDMLFFTASYDDRGKELWCISDTLLTSSGDHAITGDNRLTIYPNPNNGHFTLQLENDRFEKGVINIYDATAKLVHTQQIEDKITDIDLGKAAAGIYMLKLKLDAKTIEHKILVK